MSGNPMRWRRLLPKAGPRPRSGTAPPAAGRSTAEGCLDFVDGDRVVGWAHDPARPDLRLLVEVTAGARSLTVLADRERTDLLNAGKGDGRCGFVASLDLGGEPVEAVRARIVPEGRELHGSPFPTDLVAQVGRSARLDDLRSEIWQARLGLDEAEAGIARRP